MFIATDNATHHYTSAQKHSGLLDVSALHLIMPSQKPIQASEHQISLLMKYLQLTVLALAPYLLWSCATCPEINQKELDQMSSQRDLSIVYCGNKEGYAFFRWSQPTIPFSSDSCRKISLDKARDFDGWEKEREFDYTNDNAAWIAAYIICDIVSSPEETAAAAKR